MLSPFVTVKCATAEASSGRAVIVLFEIGASLRCVDGSDRPEPSGFQQALDLFKYLSLAAPLPLLDDSFQPARGS